MGGGQEGEKKSGETSRGARERDRNTWGRERGGARRLQDEGRGERVVGSAREPGSLSPGRMWRGDAQAARGGRRPGGEGEEPQCQEPREGGALRVCGTREPQGKRKKDALHVYGTRDPGV